MTTRQCHDCHFHNGGHHDFCPTAHPIHRQKFKAGYDAGRDRQPLDITADAAWQLGWTRGDAAADEAENSVRW